MVKLTVLAVAIVAIWLIVRAVSRGRNTVGGHARVAEDMVSCEHCGVNTPQSEAIEVGGRYFCSEEHRRLGVN